MGQAVGREEVARVHGPAIGAGLGFLGLHGVDEAQAGSHVRGVEEFDPREFDGADFVWFALVNDEAAPPGPGRGVVELHALDLEITEAVLTVEFAARLTAPPTPLVFGKAAAGDPAQ